MLASQKNRGKEKAANKSFFAWYFSVFSWEKGILYFAAATFIFATSVVAVIEPCLSLPCMYADEAGKTFENPAFDASPCRQVRFAKLLWLTREECAFGRRLLASVLLGGVIGWERREADRPAGIRTMSLVSLGSCLFTINSAFAFLKGPMAWDASRVSAAIPSGVGFLGAGLIFKKDQTAEDGEQTHVVHGLTTAASVWLSAAVGIACGGDLYFAAVYCTAAMMLLLRFGPRMRDGSEDEYSDEGSEGEITHYNSLGDLGSVGVEVEVPGEVDGLLSSSVKRRKSERSVSTGPRRHVARNRSRASLATDV